MLALAAACGGSAYQTAAIVPQRAQASAADSAMRRAISDPGAWPSYGRDYTNQRYSPLTQMTPEKVNRLRLVWRYRTGLRHAFETNPIVVGDRMYVSTPLNHAVALDAASGRKLWEYTHQLDSTIHCCGPVNRGLAVYADRVYMGTLDAKLVALDARDVRYGTQRLRITPGAIP